jgi:membrane-bound inhibitor of C-type lysozyme
MINIARLSLKVCAGLLAPRDGHSINRIFPVLTLAALGLFGPANSAFATEASYRCSDGTSVHAVFRGMGQNGSVRLTFPGQGRPVTMPQALSADGGRYSKGNMEFWIKGNTARLTRQGAVTECRTDS